MDWTHKPMRGIGLNLWAPEWYHKSISSFNAEAIAQSYQQNGVNTIMVYQGFLQDHFGISFYPTKMGPVHRNLVQGRDHIQELLEACHKRDIKVMGYYSWVDGYIWDTNPDWRQIDIDGNEVPQMSWGALCPNSPYRDHLIYRIKEIVERYDLDGMLVADSVQYFSHPVTCYCRYCQKKFREAYGRDLPRETSGFTQNWKDFIQFRHDSITELVRELRYEVKSVKPDMVYSHMPFILEDREGWETGDDYEQTIKYDDIAIDLPYSWFKARDPRHNPRQRMRHADELWQIGVAAKWLHDLSGKPSAVQIGRFPYERDYQTNASEELRMSCYTAILNGSSPAIVDNLYPDGRASVTGHRGIGEVFNEMAQLEEYLCFEGELAYAGLFYSKSSHDYIDSVHQQKYEYLNSFRSCYKILKEAKLPFKIVSEDTLTDANLSSIQVLILSNAERMTEQQVECIKRYVKNGGKLLATGRTSLVDAEGRVVRDFKLNEVFGAEYIQPVNYSVSYIVPEQNSICEPVMEELLMIRGRQQKVYLREGAQRLASLGLAATETTREARVFAYDDVDVPMGEKTLYASVIRNAYGKGECIYFASDIALAYGIYGYPNLRRLFVQAIKALSDDIPLRVAAPLTIEANGYYHHGRYHLHFVNHTLCGMRLLADAGGTIGEEIMPCHDIQIQLATDKPIKRAFLPRSGKVLPFDQASDTVTLTLPRLEVYELIILE